MWLPGALMLLMLDGDEAGQRATDELMLRLGRKVWVRTVKCTGWKTAGSAQREVMEEESDTEVQAGDAETDLPSVDNAFRGLPLRERLQEVMNRRKVSGARPGRHLRSHKDDRLRMAERRKAHRRGRRPAPCPVD